MTTSRRLAKFVPAIAVIALAVPSAAFGQATRTWVSGVGDDANPCSRTAPCKTFAAAISKTAAGGEINCLDPGGFGGATISKQLDIKGNTCGISNGALGPNASTPTTTDCGTATSASGINHTAVTSAYHNGINDNGTGMFSRGGSSFVEIAYNDITGNSSFGLNRLD